jgi:hypothetical protein
MAIDSSALLLFIGSGGNFPLTPSDAAFTQHHPELPYRQQ